MLIVDQCIDNMITRTMKEHYIEFDFYMTNYTELSLCFISYTAVNHTEITLTAEGLLQARTTG